MDPVVLEPGARVCSDPGGPSSLGSAAHSCSGIRRGFDLVLTSRPLSTSVSLAGDVEGSADPVSPTSFPPQQASQLNFPGNALWIHLVLPLKANINSNNDLYSTEENVYFLS